MTNRAESLFAMNVCNNQGPWIDFPFTSVTVDTIQKMIHTTPYIAVEAELFMELAVL